MGKDLTAAAGECPRTSTGKTSGQTNRSHNHERDNMRMSPGHNGLTRASQLIHDSHHRKTLRHNDHPRIHHHNDHLHRVDHHRIHRQVLSAHHRHRHSTPHDPRHSRGMDCPRLHTTIPSSVTALTR